jgi:CheY-like chemotaxis protein
MLTFSRRRSGDRKPDSLARLVQNAIQLLRPTLPSTIELRTELGEPLPPVAVDAVQIEQVLFNLCINARDALQRAGSIRLASRWRESDPIVCASCRARAGGSWVELEVADTGSGIDPAVMERMFDPFFTTKEVGQGSGMGLAMVHGIVHDHGGHVFVSSQPGTGTSFRIWLPSADSALPQCTANASSSARAAPLRLQGRILLVEDQSMVSAYMTELLESWGLEVTLHRHPTEAHLWYMRDPRQVDLVLTDQTMPAMTGIELAACMTSVRPDLPVLVYTGYGEGIAESDLRSAGVVAMLKKPIDPDELRGHLERLLRIKAMN